jgi:mono/diheme cytochrome c family protein
MIKMKTNQQSKANKKWLFIALVLLFGAISTPSFAQSKPWVAPKIADGVKNPCPVNSAGLAGAKKLYATNCSPCHGDKGKGDGVAAAALNPKPADHTSAAVQNETDGSLYWKLSEGRNPMPSYKKILTDQQRWEMVNYIRALAAKRK